MSAGRTFYKAREPGSLKEAEAALVAACGGLKAAAGILNLSVAQVARLTDDGEVNKSPAHLRADQVVLLEARAGAPLVTRYLALQAGCFVEPLRATTAEPIALSLGRITEETGRLLASAAQDVSDGRLSRTNAAAILRETDDLLPAIAELRASCREAVSSEAKP